MVYRNPLRQELTTLPVGDAALLQDGMLPVPDAPGLGVEIDRDRLASFLIPRHAA
jgi:L-alanine-DL-glutamate epimerase-like enolase superfamily enzyme